MSRRETRFMISLDFAGENSPGSLHPPAKTAASGSNPTIPRKLQHSNRKVERKTRPFRGALRAIQTRPCKAESIGFRNIWSKRYGEGLAVAYLEREGDSLVLELFENHHG